MAYIWAMSLGPKPTSDARIGRNAATNNAAVLHKHALSWMDVRRLQKPGRLDFPPGLIDQLTKAEMERLKKKLDRIECGPHADRILLRETAVRVLIDLLASRGAFLTPRAA
jgi:hypothetical protein